MLFGNKSTMFLKFIKDFRLKKIIKNTLTNYKAPVSGGRVVTVGILIDETYFADREALVAEVTAQGLAIDKVTALSFIDKVKKGQEPAHAYFTYNDVAADGTFTTPAASSFLQQPFDVLISFYDVQKPPLTLATLQSKAAFKAGFSTTDSRLHTFMVASQAENYKEFVAELFKYLKILQKL